MPAVTPARAVDAPGGPQQYTWKDMLTAHRGMNISEQQELMYANYAMRGEIVRV